MKIMFSGGGTLGPVVPLLAIKEIYNKHDAEAKFVWVGTSNGPEKELVEQYGIPFFTIAGGKFRRYFSFWNFVDFFKVIWGFFGSLILLWKEKPNLLVSGGGFVSVPLHWAAFCLGIPAWIHQQDYELGLANKLMSKSAKKITTALREGRKFFPENKTEWVGNPVRDLVVKNSAESKRKFNIPENAPVIFALGGGTGSMKINSMVLQILPHLPNDWHVIHLVGKDRPRGLQEKAAGAFANYHVYQFFKEEMKHAYAAADVVVARAGFATITEMASLRKAAILMPMAGTHQNANAKMLAENRAAIIFNEDEDGMKMAKIITDLIRNPEARKFLGERLHTVLPPAKPEKIIEIIHNLTGASP
ncbi:MAG: UDP-N-acetylglucosamine--N-acetylmuramyl-(pentapeptide) pyrophosphoryl-undecaprenol N-acetylglucosamine transferase [Patescibacteria group bacterium]